jgi:protein-arginine kinase activator protein McsA
MQLPKKLIHPKFTEQELIEILEKIEAMKAKAIKNQQYETAASLRDNQRKYRNQLDDLMNPPTKSNHGNSKNQD